MIEQVWTQNNCYWIDIEKQITLRDDHILVPLRGWCAYLLALDSEGKAEGMILVDDVGYHLVKDWIREEKWIDQGY